MTSKARSFLPPLISYRYESFMGRTQSISSTIVDTHRTVAINNVSFALGGLWVGDLYGDYCREARFIIWDEILNRQRHSYP